MSKEKPLAEEKGAFIYDSKKGYLIPAGPSPQNSITFTFGGEVLGGLHDVAKGKVAAEYLDSSLRIVSNSLIEISNGIMFVSQAETVRRIQLLESQLKSANSKIDQMKSKETLLRLILSRCISSDAGVLLTEEKLDLDCFKVDSTFECVVLSLDIRNSSTMMVEALDSQNYATYIAQVSRSLASIVKNNRGVFDKFTGDGVLAYFPFDYCGQDAIDAAIMSSLQCIQEFKQHYFDSRERFEVVLPNPALGAGIDVGRVTQVLTEYDTTIVGSPVVMACRLSDNGSNEVLLTQRALNERINRSANGVEVRFDDRVISIKNSSDRLVSRYVSGLSDTSPLSEPEWHKQ